MAFCGWLFFAPGGLQAAGAPSPGADAAGAPRLPPLWQAAIASVKASGGYVAGAVQTETRVLNGDEKVLGTISEVERIEWAGGKAGWKTAEKKSTGSPGMTIKADFGVQADPASAFEGYEEWRLRGTGELEGSAVEIWEGGDRKNPKSKVVAFLEVQTARPLKMEFTMPFTTPVGSMVVNATLTYAWTADRVWLPARMVMDQKGRLLFIKRHLVMIKDYQEWHPRSGAGVGRGSADGQTKRE